MFEVILYVHIWISRAKTKKHFIGLSLYILISRANRGFSASAKEYFPLSLKQQLYANIIYVFYHYDWIFCIATIQRYFKHRNFFNLIFFQIIRIKKMEWTCKTIAKTQSNLYLIDIFMFGRTDSLCAWEKFIFITIII